MLIISDIQHMCTLGLLAVSTIQLYGCGCRVAISYKYMYVCMYGCVCVAVLCVCVIYNSKSGLYLLYK